jgi:20S proteasome subunit alpha 1
MSCSNHSLTYHFCRCRVDDEVGPELFKVDPAGHFLGYKATAAGAKEQDAINALEKHFKENTTLSLDETIRLAITTMQGVLSSDFKASEIEIAIMTKNDKFKLLSDTEVEAHLTAIAEQD